jgi:hypothetical protein
MWRCVRARNGSAGCHAAEPRHARRVLVILVTVGLLMAGCTANRPPPQSDAPGRAASCTGPGAPFPRTATVYLAQHRLPPLPTLARYDVVILDSEWGHRMPHSYFARLRSAHPGVCLLAYVDLVDMPERLGTRRYWADRYALWQFQSSTTSRFPKHWMARTSGGRVVSEYPHTSMANLTDHAPRVDGQTYAEYAAQWVVRRVWSSGAWDGIYLDVWGDRIYTADVSDWDSNGDHVDEPADVIYGARNPWARGLYEAERIMRDGMPHAVLVANGDRSLAPGTLDGRAWESFLDPESRRPLAQDFRDYVRISAEAGQRQPGVSLTINVRRSSKDSPPDRRTARFHLAATLMQNGFWAPMGADYGEPARYAWLLPGGGGYLGQPVTAEPGWAAINEPFQGGVGLLAPGLYRRDFQNGIVLLNRGQDTRTVTLGEAYATLVGEPVSTVSLPPDDGLILLRRPP